MTVATRSNRVVKLQEARQAIATPDGPYTTTPAREIVMPVQRTTLSVPCAHCGASLTVSPTQAKMRVWCIPCIATDPKSLAWIYARIVPGACGCCRVWIGPRQLGYGVVNIRGQRTHAQRMVWLIERGPIDGGLFVCHDCPCSADNRECCEPSHMFLGTSRDNMQDAVRKGRTLAGERHARARVTEVQVCEIRQRYVAGEHQRDLAEAFGVAQTTISAICRGRNWSTVVRVTGQLRGTGPCRRCGADDWYAQVNRGKTVRKCRACRLTKSRARTQP